MKETHRPTFRPRNVDHSKPMQIIRDLVDFYKKEDASALNWVKESLGDVKHEPKTIIEAEVKKIIELFDKKKTIVIPNPSASASEKPAPAFTGEGKFTTQSVAYKQTEFVRPKHYIVYPEKCRLEPKVKDYEATVVDLNFLKFEKDFISVDELEKIISALENDINKGEMIPNERIKEIILSIIPDKKQHVDKVVKYWITRREEFKKSLVRKFWKDQKYTDKFLGTTFRRREREKMKTRRIKKNELETLQKLKDIRESSQKYLVNLISMMKDREATKKNILLLQQLEFEAEANLYRQDKVNVEEKYRDFLKTLPKQTKLIPFVSPEKPMESGKENREKRREPSYIPGIKHEPLQAHIANEVTDTSLNEFPQPQQQRKLPNNGKRIKPVHLRPEKQIPTPVSLLGQIKIELKKPVEKPSEIILKHRIRLDRNHNLIIDRYVQTPSGFSPFDDDFNKLINKYKIYNEDFVLNTKKTNDFSSFYEDYLKDKFNGLVVSDSEEDQSNVTTQIRSFSSSYKQFLKHKRSHPDVV